MPKKVTKRTSKKASSERTESFGRRGMWKGSISFGLVNVPVQLYASNQGEQLSFNMLDKRDHSRIGYKQINKTTGKDVDRSQIVKGYQFESGEYVLLTDSDFEKANPKAAKTIEIEDFVNLADVDVLFFEKPYYVVPQKGGEKGYALLRKVLEKTKKAAIAKVVLSRKQHLAALIVKEDYIVLELLRFADEILEVHEIEPMSDLVKNAKVTEREIEIAEQLVEGMTSEWEPDKYKDTYREDLMKMIQGKIRSGHTATVNAEEQESTERYQADGNVLDLTSLLKKSLNAARPAKKPMRKQRKV